MLRIIYNLLLHLALPFIFLRLLWRSIKNSYYRKNWLERLAFYDTKSIANFHYNCDNYSKIFWIHAVSLGEVVAVTPLIKKLLQQNHCQQIVFTTMTPTGMAQMQKIFCNENYSAKVLCLYVPYDYSWAIGKFIRIFKPHKLLIMETELWPNLIHITHKNNIPIFLINARLTEKSFASYVKIQKFVAKMLNKIDIIFAQSIKDADFFLKLGAKQDKVINAGNIKFDISLPIKLDDQVTQLANKFNIKNRQIWIAASTHENEEAIVLEAFKTIKQTLPTLLLIIVPRHLERFANVEILCKKNGFNLIKYSQNQSITNETDIFLADVMGKLLELYSLANVAFVGGSLVPIGGHNILEPALCKLPIIVGPYTQTLADIMQIFITNNAILLANNSMELAEKVIYCFNNLNLDISENNNKLGYKALSLVEQNKGIIDNILSLL